MLTPPLDEGQHKINEAFAQSLQKKVHAVGPACLVQPAGPSPFEIAETMSDAGLHIICGKPHIVCGDRIWYAVSAFDMRRPHTICGNRKWYAVPASNMRSLNMIRGCRIQYAVAAYNMRSPNVTHDT